MSHAPTTVLHPRQQSKILSQEKEGERVMLQTAQCSERLTKTIQIFMEQRISSKNFKSKSYNLPYKQLYIKIVYLYIN